MHLGRLLPMSDWIWKRENLNILFSDVLFWIVRTGYQHELREIQNIENRKLDMLRNKHKPTHDAVMWYKENQSRFQGEVHLPLLLSVSTCRYSKTMEMKLKISFKKIYKVCHLNQLWRYILKDQYIYLHLHASIYRYIFLIHLSICILNSQMLSYIMLFFSSTIMKNL